MSVRIHRRINFLHMSPKKFDAKWPCRTFGAHTESPLWRQFIKHLQ